MMRNNKLYISNIGLTIHNKDLSLLKPKLMVNELFKPILQYYCSSIPSFYLRGDFIKNKHAKPFFVINEKGSDILFLSEIPFYLKMEAFKISGTSYQFLYRDKFRTYLSQIHKLSDKYNLLYGNFTI